MALPNLRTARFTELSSGDWFWTSMPKESGVGPGPVLGLRADIKPDLAPSTAALVLFNLRPEPVFVRVDALRGTAVLFAGGVSIEPELETMLSEAKANDAPIGTLVLDDNRWFVPLVSYETGNADFHLELTEGSLAITRRRPRGAQVAFSKWRIVRATGQGGLLYQSHPKNGLDVGALLA